MRLGLMSRLFDLTQYGYSIHFPRFSDMDKWHKEVLDVLVKMEALYRHILPLPGKLPLSTPGIRLIVRYLIVVAEQDSFKFHMLLFYYHFCRLLILHQAIREARRVFRENYPEKLWHQEFIYHGVNLARVWGQDAMLAAEAVLVTILSRPESISSAPDIVFAMVSFAALWLIIAKNAVYQNRGEHLPGASDSLLAKVIEWLTQSAVAADHTPAKCAQVIAASFKAFANRTSLVALDSQDDLRSKLGHGVSAERFSAMKATVPAHAVPPMEGMHNSDVLNDASLHEPNPFMHSDIFLDTDFWSSFMDNLSAGQN
jgi:hypothetical protein